METEKRSSVSSLLLSVGVAVVLLTPLAVYVILRTQEAGSGMRKEQASAVESAAQTPQKKQVIPSVESDRPKPKPVSKPAPVAVTVPQPPPSPQRPFPTPRDIPVGMDKYRLIASFGNPNFVTTEVTEGRASEIFRYLRPDAGVETVVFLRSGRVINATSTVY